MEERKMCHVGRYSDRHVGTVLPSHNISDNWCSTPYAKYAPLTQSYLFVPIAVETMGAINRVGKEFLSDLGRRITQMTNEKREGAFLFQRLSMGTFALTSPEDEL